MNNFYEKSRTEKSGLDNIRDLKPEEIASLHNECVSFMLNNHPQEFDKIITTENLIAEVGWFSDFLLERLPESEHSILNVKEGLIKKIKEYGDNENNRSRFILLVFSEEDFRKELETSNLSPSLIDDICLLHKYLLKGKDGSELANEQWTLILNKNYVKIDSYAVSYMVAVGNASLELWEEHPVVSKVAGNCPPNGMTCNEWQIICDGLGSAIGTIFGGIGAALTGALFSYAVARECEDCDQQNA